MTKWVNELKAIIEEHEEIKHIFHERIEENKIRSENMAKEICAQKGIYQGQIIKDGEGSRMWVIRDVEVLNRFPLVTQSADGHLISKYHGWQDDARDITWWVGVNLVRVVRTNIRGETGYRYTKNSFRDYMILKNILYDIEKGLLVIIEKVPVTIPY